MELSDADALEVMDNIKLNLAQGSGHLTRINLYGKVVDKPEASRPTTRVRFTAVPPEVLTYFEGLLVLR